MQTCFKSQAGKDAILSLYDQKLNALNIEYQTRMVSTSFGETHLITTGDPANPPLVLVHGSNGCAPIALETYPHLMEKYRVFAVDLPAQPNKSEGTRLSMNDLSYGYWMIELMEQLRISNVTMAGFSFGGLVILKTLLTNEAFVKEAFLASPAYIINGNPLSAFWKIFIPLKTYQKTKDPKQVEKFLKALFTERDPFAIEYLSWVFLHFDMDFNPIPVISKSEAASIQTPLTIIGARKDILFPGKKMIKKARKEFPALRRAILLEESRHVQNRAANNQIEELIMNSD